MAACAGFPAPRFGLRYRHMVILAPGEHRYWQVQQWFTAVFTVVHQRKSLRTIGNIRAINSLCANISGGVPLYFLNSFNYPARGW